MTEPIETPGLAEQINSRNPYAQAPTDDLIDTLEAQWDRQESLDPLMVFELIERLGKFEREWIDPEWLSEFLRTQIDRSEILLKGSGPEAPEYWRGYLHGIRVVQDVAFPRMRQLSELVERSENGETVLGIERILPGQRSLVRDGLRELIEDGRVTLKGLPSEVENLFRFVLAALSADSTVTLTTRMPARPVDQS